MFLDVTQIALRKSRLCTVRRTRKRSTLAPFTQLIMTYSCLSSVIVPNRNDWWPLVYIENDGLKTPSTQ